MSVFRVLLDQPDRKMAARSRLFLLIGIAVLTATAVLATYGRTWSWTGFRGNENVWQWLQLLSEPAALIIVLLQLLSPPNPRTMVVGLSIAVAALAVLMVGGYAMGWAWTGFGEYRLWDWLQLLVLPVMIILLPLWLRAGAHVARPVAWLLGAIGASLVVAFVGGYVFGWAWTGCVGKTFRDWLGLLITPFALPLICGWFLAAQQGAHPIPPPEPPAPDVDVATGTELAKSPVDLGVA